MSAGAWPVVLVAIACSIMAITFYVRHIRLMFFTDPHPDGAGAVTRSSVLTSATIVVCLVATLTLGVVPGPVLDLVTSAGDFIR